MLPIFFAVLALALPLQEPAPAPAGSAESVEAAAVSAPSASASLDAGLRAYHRRQYQRAIENFEKAAEADPQNAAAAWYLAYTTYKVAERKRPFDPGKQRAAELFAKAYAIDPAFKPDWRRP